MTEKFWLVTQYPEAPGGAKFNTLNDALEYAEKGVSKELRTLHVFELLYSFSSTAKITVTKEVPTERVPSKP